MKTKEEYFNTLRSINNIKPLTQQQIELARRYAYSFFIQRQITINIINKKEGHFGNIDLNKLKKLLPGNDLIMDAICNGIVSGKDIILDEKMVKESEIEI